jgi:2-oxoglutarate dehydrogenase E1 component
MEECYVKSKSLSYELEDWKTEEWADVANTFEVKDAQATGMDVEVLREIGTTVSTLPTDKIFHRLVKKIFEQRVQSYKTGTGIDWGTAEALAFSTLI